MPVNENARREEIKTGKDYCPTPPPPTIPHSPRTVKEKEEL